MREAIDFVAKHLLCEARIDGVRREERWNIPPLAVREAIVNAVAHADYAQRGAPIRVAVFDDRVEVENPGLLPFGLTVEDLPFGVSKLRNRVISRVFREIGLMENWGSGVQRMMAACEGAGCPPPMFEELGGRFRVTLGTAARRTVVDAVDTALLNALRVAEGLSTGELAALVGRSPRTVRTRMKRLVARGLVREIGAGPNDPRRRYHLIG